MDPAWIIDEAPAGALISSFSLLHLNIPELEPCDDVSEAWRPNHHQHLGRTEAEGLAAAPRPSGSVDL